MPNVGKLPVFWSRCEDAGSINLPVIGAGALNGTPSYEAVMFSNGVICDANGKGVTATLASANMAEGCIEYWAKAKRVYNAYSNNYILCGSATYPIMSFGYNSWGVTNTLQIYIYFNSAIFVWQLPNVASGGVFHFAVSWSTGKLITSGQSVAVYWDGVKQTAMVGAYNDPTATIAVPSFTGLRIGRGAGAEHADLTHDNIKIWDFAKEDFSDRFRERGGMKDFQG